MQVMRRALAGIRVVGACIGGVGVGTYACIVFGRHSGARARDGWGGRTARFVSNGERGGEATERESVGPLPYVLHRREPTGYCVEWDDVTHPGRRRWRRSRAQTRTRK